MLWIQCFAPVQAAGPDRQAVATAHPLATEAGLEVLAAGGNAFDAAVAVTAALAVVEPYSSGLGGGGFYLLRDGRGVRMLDARERAPLAASRNMYLDAQGEPVEGLSIDGALAAGIPGIPAALDRLAHDYGQLSLSRTLQPAIRLAREGFAVDDHYRRLAEFRLEALRRFPASAPLLQDGGAPADGYVVRQPDLGETLTRIAARGAAGFYQGSLAETLVSAVQAAGGIWTLRDLADYRVVMREPIHIRYAGYDLYSAAPPSSGGVVIGEMLNIVSGFDLASADAVNRTHLLVEAMRRAYRDRAEYLGDPDFVDMPLPRLLSADYAAELRRGIDPGKATPSSSLPPVVAGDSGRHTTHFSILDRAGNMVSATLSINYPFGSGMVVPGTGVLLNDEMDDFSMRPGVPNVYGLVGAEANAIEPGKRMLSSMSPTIMDNGERVAIFGTPGGSRIITMVLLGALDFQSGGNAGSIVRLPRFHHQYLPDRIQLEPDALDAQTRQQLQAMGHELQPLERTWGNMQAVTWDRRSGTVEAASDPRGVGAAAVR